MKKKHKPILTHVVLTCSDCYGYSNVPVSSCCFDDIDSKGRCCGCKKSCDEDVCFNCDGRGSQDIYVGDDVAVYMSPNSPSYLKKQFSNAKYNHGKIYYGKLKEIINDETVLVKLSTRLIKIHVCDLSFT